nr:multiple epidermal growth factor-like domains protein 10 isoform X5 [Helicoverpa armigera]
MCLKTIVFCFLVILLVLEFVCFVEALDDNGEGVCVVKLSTRQRRKKPYNVAINKWCGRKKCVVRKYRFETYLTWTNHTVCCNGWQHDAELDKCAPICSTGCHGGRCVSPDQCQCDSPNYIDPERPNTCITPVCEPTCFNADCRANNTCICKEDYTSYNATHCFKCDPGYTADENLNCVPICDNPCVNSTCTAPNTCTCSEGYRHKNNSICEPICDCVNADCTGPNQCSCHKGYTPVNKTTCAPKCNSCSHGDCVAPNNCSCHSGYVKIKGVCKPKCSECVNGFCTAPGVCTCKNGYVKSDSSANICVVPCDDKCKGYCEDGGCVKWNCSSTPIRGHKVPKGLKKAVCCNNYEYDMDLDECLPICSNGCENGECVDVDTCECKPPLVLVNYACVQPVCSGCEHGECVAPGVCKCHAGYVTQNGSCAPVCSSVCVNGRCVAPNRCECSPGHAPDPSDAFKCNPICDTPCVNGTCAAHNKCICSVGYEPTGNSAVCRPTCAGCEHGQCVAPNQCICSVGYERINSTCKPQCSSCSNGDCVAPGKCECHEGYELKGEDCAPICTPPCNNGQCLAPNNCSCNPGYNLTAKGCEPICSKPCVNGKCSAPDFCSCDTDYMKNDTDQYTCYKPCDPACFNGTCSLHGECNCFDDFEYDDATKPCEPVKPIDCNLCDGKCEDSKEVCRCANHTLCVVAILQMPAEAVASDVKMAGMNMMLMAIGGACLLLLILVVVVMQRIWHKRNDYGKPTSENTNLDSVMYTVPHTLITQRNSRVSVDETSCYEGEEDVTNTDTLLQRPVDLP